MKKLLTYLPFHFSVWLIIGIYFQFSFEIYYFQKWTLFVILGFLVFFLFALHVLNQKVLFTFVSWFLFFFLGISAVFLQKDCNKERYYQHFLRADVSAVYHIRKVLKPSNFYDKYEAEVLQINQQKTLGRILLNIEKDSSKNTLQVDDKIFDKAVFQEVKAPLNLYEFNYKTYLKKKGIEQQVFLKKGSFLRSKRNRLSSLGFAHKIRKRIQLSLQSYAFSKDELAVIYALLLGQRQDLSKELMDEYSKAGAIHILAVSGLHIGIVLWLLSFLFSPLEQVKNGKFLKVLFLVLFLWLFALIAGLSASVVRAVTMFTFLAVGYRFLSKKVIEFSLVSSLFFLLLLHPLFLFDIGFQLSYTAVFGIVWMQPKLYAILKSKWKFLNYFSQLIAVSLAAQLAVLPISLYYFNQFPGLFILSNLVIIPVLGTVLIGGILVMLFAVLGVLPDFLAHFYANIISLLNKFVGFVSTQEAFLWKEISVSLLFMISFYLIIFSGFQFLAARKATGLCWFFTAIIFMQSVVFFEKYQRNKKSEIIVFQNPRNSIIGKRLGGKLFVYSRVDSLEYKQLRALKSYKIAENIDILYVRGIPNILTVHQKNILLIDSLGIYRDVNVKKPIVVLQNSPKINLERLIKTIDPVQIIADGSNYKHDILAWESTCEKELISFFSTAILGAKIIK
jgi:competence protein ComEC